MIHYTYEITHKNTGKRYIGVRSTDIEPEDDLGKQYFSSSTDTDFVCDQKKNTEMYYYKVLQKFDSRSEANLHEIQLHEEFEVGASDEYYNKCKANSTLFSMHGVKFTEEHRKKLSTAKIGSKRPDDIKKSISLNSRKPKSETHKRNISKGRKGIIFTESHIKNLSESHKGNILSDKSKKLISDKLKGIDKESVICPHCNKKGGKPSMKRWHFDNCKSKPLDSFE